MLLLLFFKNTWMPKFDWSLSITKLVQKAHDVDTLGGAFFGHGHIVKKMAEIYKMMLHTKYQGSRASDFRQEVLSFLLGIAISDIKKIKFHHY